MHAWKGDLFHLSHGELVLPGTGRHIERVQRLGRLLDIHFSAGAGPAQIFRLAGAAKFCTAFEPYTKQYTASIRPQRSPNSCCSIPNFPFHLFSVDRMTEALARVAPGAPPARRAAVGRLAGRLKAAVDFGRWMS
jgi:uncharacterized alpha-E superfamily protein